VRASKIGLLLLILAFGGVVETAWVVENRFDVGPSGCRVLGLRHYGPSFTFEAQQSHPVAAGTALEVENAFGAVRVKRGQPGTMDVHLRKVVFRRTEAEARAFAENIKLKADAQGTVLRLTTNRGELEGGRDTDNVGFETHLEVTVPPDTPVKVQNEHGEVEVIDAARAEVWNSFDSVRVERVAGAVSVDARHSDVAVAAVGGDLTLSNRHGRVEVRDVKGKARVQSEHGNVSVANVGGAVLSASHGELSVQGVLGDLEVTGQHAQVTASEVTGGAQVETSFQSIQARQIGGQARLKVQHGGVELTDARGPVHVEATYGEVKLSRVAGVVEVSVAHGGLHAENLEQGAQVRATGGEVVLEGFAGVIDVEVERAGARLVPRGPLEAAVAVRTLHGRIDLEVPAGSGIDLEALVRQGDFELEVPGLTVDRTTEGGGAERIKGRLGSGAHAVRLTTEHGSVRVSTPTAVARQP
jgi:DUF4097 and DUF4098 domain-containing protein YvlB